MKLRKVHKIVVVCPECKSADVTCDALARWDIDTQQWVWSSSLDNKQCNDCGYDSDIFNEVELSAFQTKGREAANVNATE